MRVMKIINTSTLLHRETYHLKLSKIDSYIFVDRKIGWMAAVLNQERLFFMHPAGTSCMP